MALFIGDHETDINFAAAFDAVSRVIDETIEMCAKICDSAVGADGPISDNSRSLASRMRSLKGK